ncbi:tryptophan synthase subunit beta like protein [Oceanimonas baumannii]|nr:tryptophan synthase subunit beta like protein [Oceanimonas baumannii]TDW57031.1 hypothetical protein LY04_02836 [Oceanimonas baumannii]
MMFVKRDTTGSICAASLEKTPDINEPISGSSPELAKFIGVEQQHPLPELDPLRESDLAMSRVLEDLIDLLIDKKLIQFTELPAMAQQKLLARQSLRTQCRLDLLGDNDADDEQIPMI